MPEQNDTSPLSDPFEKSREGVRLLRAGKTEEAIAAFTEAVSLYPDFKGAYRNRAQAYRTVGRGEEARADLDKANSMVRLEEPSLITRDWGRQAEESRLRQIPRPRQTTYQPAEDSRGCLGGIVGGFVGLIVGLIVGLFYLSIFTGPAGAIVGGVFGVLLGDRVGGIVGGIAGGVVGGIVGGIAVWIILIMIFTIAA